MKLEIESQPRSKDSRRATAEKGPSKRALVIIGEPAVRGLVQDALGSAGIESVILNEIVDADEQLQAEKFDVMFVGLHRFADGIELVKRIRNSGLNWKTPIIAVSDDQRPEALPKIFEAGATFFVYQPLDKAHLNRLIRVSQGTIERERRRFRRVPVNVKVRLKSGETEIAGETIDVSLNGALVTAPRTFPLGAVLDITLYVFGDGNPIVGKGSIVRIIDNVRMGILLDHLSAKESARLQDFLLPKIEE